MSRNAVGSLNGTGSFDEDLITPHWIYEVRRRLFGEVRDIKK
jgi:hypothetical protein